MDRKLMMRFMILIIRYMRKMAPEATYLERQSEKIERDIALALQEEVSEEQVSAPNRKVLGA